MKRRINFTERHRIQREHVDVSVRPAGVGDFPSFDLTVDFARYDFPPGSPVRVEASRSNVAQRWEWGVIGDLRPPLPDDRRLTRVPASAMFKVFVAAADGSGVLLGLADRVKPVLPILSLIPVEEGDLGGDVWRVDFGDGQNDQPVLKVNSAIEGMSNRVRNDDDFRTLVLPDVLRTVLVKFLLVERVDLDDDDTNQWWRAWLRLAHNIASAHAPLDADADTNDPSTIQDRERWISDIVEVFARERVHAVSRYSQFVARQ